MKLGELRSAIRNHRGHVHVQTSLGGVSVAIPVMKTPFMKETLLDFAESKADETGLTFTDGLVHSVNSAPQVKAPSAAAPPAAPPATLDDDDDLLGDDLLADTLAAAPAEDDDDDLLG